MHRTMIAGLLLWIAAALACARPAAAAPTLAAYRYFRALSIDLAGRMPTRDEIAAFERDGFNLDAWIDKQLQGTQYAARLERVYEDLLRLEVGTAFQFVQPATVLRRQTILGPNGANVYVYWRDGQRRVRPDTDGTFCLTQSETGLQFPRNAPPTGTPIAVSQQTLDAATVVVKPWWLYRDYNAQSPPGPIDRYDPMKWAALGYQPAAQLLVEPDGTTPTMSVRVCKEEAQQAATGTVYTSGRTKNPPMPPFGRLDYPPLDSAFAIANAGKPIACNTQTAVGVAADCGCGPGLWRCMPGAGLGFDNPGFVVPSRLPLGPDMPLDASTQTQGGYARLWWGQEAAHFLNYVFANDRDFREVLNAPYTVVNGPLAQFYQAGAPEQCCGQAVAFGMLQPEPLFDPGVSLPAGIDIHDANTWTLVTNRGPHASGLLTMPIFLTKYGTRRARAHVLWQAFACKDFVAGNIQLKPSTEPDLTKRDGCNICHTTLEPLAAFFTRIQESTWMYLPQSMFPIESSKCANADPTKMSNACKTFYDPAFTTAMTSKMRGAYASEANADAGPAGLAQYLTSTSQFESCAAQNVAASFIGRALTPDDQVLQQQLAQVFASGGYKMRALVKALVKSDAYKTANNMTSTVLRSGGAL